MRAAALLLAALAALAGCSAPATPVPAQARLVVLGFDGMDPVLVERWMDQGKLPHLARLRSSGAYQRLATSNPPQSPVAWSAFATGTGAGEHGIFDFLRRDPATYRPDFSIASYVPPKRSINFVGWTLPLGSGEVRNRRQGEPFWSGAEADGRRATVLRVPVTFPPEAITRMLAGMGVPDLLGSQGTYTIYATRRLANAENGGRLVLMRMDDDGVVDTTLEGPAHPLRPAAPALSLPMRLKAGRESIQIELAGETRTVAVGAWSSWWPLSFGHAFGSVPAMVRVHVAEGWPRPVLYVSPIQADPADPALALSSPPGYAADLASRIGRFHTLGMPEETWSLNQGHLDESAFLDMVRTTLVEGEAMLHDALDRNDSELLIKVFVQPDRVSHMFWRGIDPGHPLHADSSEQARGAIEWIYRESDRIVGEVLDRLGPDDRLVVLSDHGFAPFRRAVHLNRWLAEHGWLVLKEGASASEPLFASVDWSRSRAYALGLNGVFVNRSGREAQGIVAPEQARAVADQIAAGLAGFTDGDGSAVVRRSFHAADIYPGANAQDAPDLVIGYAPGYRASWQTTLGAVPSALIEDNTQRWSGDHCIDPEAVPGVLFTSFRPGGDVADIAAMAHFLLAHLPAGPAAASAP
jgi:predicted AlkP superfamily phosphohydrolase/phosphomutase